MAFAMTPSEAQAWAVAVREMKRSVLVDGSDYSVIPGTNKPSLLKPGAEMLLLAAGLGFTMLKIEDEGDIGRGGVTYRCSVHRGDRSNVMAECDGYAGYDEDRFYQSAQQSEAKERANATKWKRAPKEEKFVEYRAPWNSVVKMAQKRALVGAALNACAASGLFTQDIEDDHSLPPLWDATVVVKPHVDGLNPVQSAALKAWWKLNGLPSLASLTAEQGARVLVQVGIVLAERPTPPPVTPPVQSPEPTSPAPHGAAQTAEKDDPDGAPFTDALESALDEAKGKPKPPWFPGDPANFWQPGEGPKLPLGVKVEWFTGPEGSLSSEDREKWDKAWRDHANVMVEYVQWTDEKAGRKPNPPTRPLFTEADETLPSRAERKAAGR